MGLTGSARANRRSSERGNGRGPLAAAMSIYYINGFLFGFVLVYALCN
jgi:hypothetical protein